MKRLLLIVSLAGTLALATGCDELEDLTIDLGGWGAPFGYGGTHYSARDCCEEVWYEEEYREDYYYVEELWYDDWYYWP